jgi:DNA polymerase I-like protein with 3'-5' exonuclease and polymerase domains
VQTVPKRNDLAAEFRRMVVAAPGCLLVECDSSAIEAVLVGYFAGSQRYINLAKRGVHKWLAEKYAGRPVSKSEPLYDQIKRVVHLSNYMGTPQRIHEEYPNEFATVAEARKLQDFYFSTDEGQDVRKWQQSTLEQAHKEHMLETPWKQRHYFYDVFHSANGQWSMGDDAKRAVAFRPQASASAIQTDFVIAADQTWMANHLRWIVHDSIICEVPEEKALAMAIELKCLMEYPVAQLDGISIGAEAKVGPNLRDMKVVE